MEQALFVKGKDPILVEYLRVRKKLGSSVAGRGFSFEPGFMYDAQNDLEIDTKAQLSALNYEILKEAVDQDIKQAGLDYDLAFKNAQIVWELDKQVLLSDWDKELIGIKQAQQHEEELLNLLAIEVSKRANLLLEAKTAIELEAEAIRLQIAELDASTGDYELQLANAKLMTANKKLEVIPIFQQIIEIEEDILGKEIELLAKAWILAGKADDIVEKEMEIVGKNEEIVNRQNEIITAERGVLGAEEDVVDVLEDKVSAEQDLISAATDTVEAREALITPALIALIAKMEEYIEELAVQLDIQNQIAEQKLAITDIKTEQLSKDEAIIELKQDLIEAMGEVVSLTEGLYEYKTSNLSPAISELTDMVNQYAETDVMLQAGFKLAIAGIKEQLALITPQKVDGELSIITAETAQEAQRSALQSVEGQIDVLVSANRLADANDATAKITQLATTEDTARTTVNSAQESAFYQTEDLKTQAQQKRFDIQIDNETEMENKNIEAQEDRVTSDINRDEDVTQIIIDTDVTARLSHLLSQD